MSGNYFSISREYDGDGNVTLETYYTVEGVVGPNKSGVIMLEKAYDSQKHVTLQRYLDAEGQPMTLAGVGQIAMDYDAAGNMIRETNMDMDGYPTVSAAGWCRHDITYDADKHRISERYTDGE